MRADEISALIAEAGLSDAVDVVASPSDQAVKTLMGTSSFVASSSEYEGFGVAAVEGMSAGLIPLLSEIPPFRRLIARTGLGITIDYSSPDAAARLLLERLPEIASSYAERRAACMQATKAYDWPGVCQEYSKFYDAVTGATVRTILDVPVQVQTFDAAVEDIDARYAKREPVAIAFANAHTLNVAAESVEFRWALQQSLGPQ